MINCHVAIVRRARIGCCCAVAPACERVFACMAAPTVCCVISMRVSGEWETTPSACLPRFVASFLLFCFAVFRVAPPSVESLAPAMQRAPVHSPTAEKKTYARRGRKGFHKARRAPSDSETCDAAGSKYEAATPATVRKRRICFRNS